MLTEQNLQREVQVRQPLTSHAHQVQQAQVQVQVRAPHGIFRWSPLSGGSAQHRWSPAWGIQHVWGSVSRLTMIAVVCSMVLCRQWPNGHGLLRVLQRD